MLKQYIGTKTSTGFYKLTYVGYIWSAIDDMFVSAYKREKKIDRKISREKERKRKRGEKREREPMADRLQTFLGVLLIFVHAGWKTRRLLSVNRAPDVHETCFGPPRRVRRTHSTVWFEKTDRAVSRRVHEQTAKTRRPRYTRGVRCACFHGNDNNNLFMYSREQGGAAYDTCFPCS